MEADEGGKVANKKSHRRELWTPIPVTSHLGLVGTGENRYAAPLSLAPASSAHVPMSTLSPEMATEPLNLSAPAGVGLRKGR